eukprot:scaffold1_cov402-Prasinococcus_capsulatus_cf.AAC.48
MGIPGGGARRDPISVVRRTVHSLHQLTMQAEPFPGNIVVVLRTLFTTRALLHLLWESLMYWVRCRQNPTPTRNSSPRTCTATTNHTLPQQAAAYSDPRGCRLSGCCCLLRRVCRRPWWPSCSASGPKTSSNCAFGRCSFRCSCPTTGTPATHPSPRRGCGCTPSSSGRLTAARSSSSTSSATWSASSCARRCGAQRTRAAPSRPRTRHTRRQRRDAAAVVESATPQAAMDDSCC